MINSFNELPKNVQKLVKKLAEFQRKQLEVLQAGDMPDTVEIMGDLFTKGDQVVHELLSTKFAVEELGVFYPEEDFYKDDLQETGEYFLGLYALERLMAEENGKKCSEDLFYAGALLRQRASFVEDMEEENGYDECEEGFFGESEENELEMLLDKMTDTFGSEETDKNDSKIIPLFGKRDEYKPD